MNHITSQHKNSPKEQLVFSTSNPNIRLERETNYFSTATTERKKKFYISIKSRKRIVTNHKVGKSEFFFQCKY